MFYNKTARRNRAAVLANLIRILENQLDRYKIESALPDPLSPIIPVTAETMLEDAVIVEKIKTMRAEAVREYLLILNKDKQLRAAFYQNLATAA